MCWGALQTCPSGSRQEATSNMLAESHCRTGCGPDPLVQRVGTSVGEFCATVVRRRNDGLSVDGRNEFRFIAAAILLHGSRQQVTAGNRRLKCVSLLARPFIFLDKVSRLVSFLSSDHCTLRLTVAMLFARLGSGVSAIAAALSVMTVPEGAVTFTVSRTVHVVLGAMPSPS